MYSGSFIHGDSCHKNPPPIVFSHILYNCLQTSEDSGRINDLWGFFCFFFSHSQTQGLLVDAERCHGDSSPNYCSNATKKSPEHICCFVNTTRVSDVRGCYIFQNETSSVFFSVVFFFFSSLSACSHTTNVSTQMAELHRENTLMPILFNHHRIAGCSWLLLNKTVENVLSMYSTLTVAYLVTNTELSLERKYCYIGI